MEATRHHMTNQPVAAPPLVLGTSAAAHNKVDRRALIAKTNSIQTLRVEMECTKQAAPQALAVPSQWRKEDSFSNYYDSDQPYVPPCEIIFDASITELADDSDLESMAPNSSCDSVAGSCCGDDSESLATNDSCCQEEQEEEQEEEPVVDDISDAELTRQLKAIQVNPFPSRAHGIFQHWHALCTLNPDEFCGRLMEHGGMEAILDAMILQKDHPEVQEAACWVLAALVARESTFKEWFAECSGMQSVLNAMKTFPRDAWVQEAAIAALQCWTYQHPPSQELLAADGMEVILKAMRKHTTVAAVQEQGCAVLANLAANSSIRQSVLDDAGARSDILGAVEAHPNELGVQVNGCKALANMTHAADCSDAIRAVGAPQQ